MSWIANCSLDRSIASRLLIHSFIVNVGDYGRICGIMSSSRAVLKRSDVGPRNSVEIVLRCLSLLPTMAIISVDRYVRFTFKETPIIPQIVQRIQFATPGKERERG